MKILLGTTSTIYDHTKQKPDEPHFPNNNEMLAKRVRVEIKSQNTTIYSKNFIVNQFG